MGTSNWRANVRLDVSVVEFGIVKVHSSHKALISVAKGQCGTVDVHGASISLDDPHLTLQKSFPACHLLIHNNNKNSGVQ